MLIKYVERLDGIAQHFLHTSTLHERLFKWGQIQAEVKHSHHSHMWGWVEPLM